MCHIIYKFIATYDIACMSLEFIFIRKKLCGLCVNKIHVPEITQTQRTEIIPLCQCRNADMHVCPLFRNSYTHTPGFSHFSVQCSSQLHPTNTSSPRNYSRK